MLKKVVSTSRKLANLQTDSARLLWTWILPHVDIKGRFSAEPDIVKGSIVPRLRTMTVGKIDKYILDMAANDMILLYNHNGDRYLEVVKFEDFQTLRADREAASIIPPPGDAGVTPGVPPDNSGLSKAKTREDKGSQDKLVIEESSHEGEGLGLKQQIKIQALRFIEGLEQKFHHISQHEATTFSRIAHYLSDQMLLTGMPIETFDEALGWADTATTSGVKNPKGLWVAKVKEQTGFTGRGKLLE